MTDISVGSEFHSLGEYEEIGNERTDIKLLCKGLGLTSDIEGKYIEEEKKLVVNVDNPKGYCPTCPNKIGFQVKYTDVLIISQFMTPDGLILPRKITGLCNVGHSKMMTLIHQTQRAGLTPELRPPLPDGKERQSHLSQYKWKKYNVYYNPGKMPYPIPYHHTEG